MSSLCVFGFSGFNLCRIYTWSTQGCRLLNLFPWLFVHCRIFDVLTFLDRWRCQNQQFALTLAQCAGANQIAVWLLVSLAQQGAWNTARSLFLMNFDILPLTFRYRGARSISRKLAVLWFQWPHGKHLTRILGSSPSPSGAILACSSSFAAASSLPSGQRSSTRPISLFYVFVQPLLGGCWPKKNTTRRTVQPTKTKHLLDSVLPNIPLAIQIQPLTWSWEVVQPLVQAKKLHSPATSPRKNKLSYTTNYRWPS